MSESKRCMKCRELTLEKIVDDGYLIAPNALDFLFKPTSEQETCDVCSIIRHSLRYDRGKLRIYTNSSEVEMSLFIFRNPPSFSGHRLQQLDVIAMPSRLRGGHWVGGTDGYWHFGPPDDKPQIARGIIVVHCGQASFMNNRLPAQNVEATESAKVATRWLDECLESHGGRCAANESSKLPTRVVDVGCGDDFAQLKLTEPNGQSGKYAALSYCWGKTPFFKLTSTNKESLMKSIPFEQLPQTIQDVIRFTKMLGIRYLWVDCLCIIQGVDEEAREDWLKESQQMMTVFGEAFLTISASGSANAHEGIFKERTKENKQHCTIPASESNSTPILLNFNSRKILPENEPLGKRGWTFQENILPRLGLSMTLEAEALLLYTNWTKIVDKYSSTSLTLISDRLAAIQGIIDFIQVRYQEDTCVAGLWKRELLAQLLWKHTLRKESCSKSLKFPDNSCFGSKPNDEQSQKNRPAQILFASPTRTMIRGGLKKIDTIRRVTRGEYNGLYELFPPWRNFTASMQTWIDDVVLAVPRVGYKAESANPPI
ncbi:HET-domain-containing protein [Annulohypoxylon maeteangense]|uniref:HET-domain-containing protein n=1 Tax=Annulohypoxylon maeteangense TaxID=1927788 RepID=UPI0020074CDC|nr:HET-domain-containing protein [Annulohypoxylon maeteangense]KAI0880123.1 HET-domain-containing protein [Annulohypoxylon maeteangense]